jgi:methionine-rich copper-binding protein CopC
MRTLRGVLGAAVLTAIGAAAVTAHVELITSSPPAGANLASPPAEVTITFDDELNPDESSFTVTGGGSAQVGAGGVDLTVVDRNVMAGPITITEPGIYTVIYTAAGVDGHEVAGIFSFGYLATAAIPAPTSDDGPDTAMAVPSRNSPLLLLGVLSLAAAVVILLRRIMEAR